MVCLNWGPGETNAHAIYAADAQHYVSRGASNRGNIWNPFEQCKEPVE